MGRNHRFFEYSFFGITVYSVGVGMNIGWEGIGAACMSCDGVALNINMPLEI